MKKLIYKGLYVALLRLTNRFNIRLFAKYKILLGTALLLILSSCIRGGEREKDVEITCYDVAPSQRSVQTETGKPSPQSGNPINISDI